MGDHHVCCARSADRAQECRVRHRLQQPVRRQDRASLPLFGSSCQAPERVPPPPPSPQVTGSFDKTARIWDATTGECLQILRGHQTEIVALCVVCVGGWWFPAPYLISIAVLGGAAVCRATARSSFNPQSTMVATGSMDNTAKLWAVDTGEELATLNGHQVRYLCPAGMGSRPHRLPAELSGACISAPPRLWRADHRVPLCVGRDCEPVFQQRG
jgi:hypothetical protein